MQPLTEDVWAKHFTELRPYVLEEFPDVPREDLQVVGDDWDGLVALVHRATGMSADLVRQRLRKLDVDELGLGTGADRAEDDDRDRASVDQVLLHGFSEAERERILERLRKLDRRLRKFPADATDLELTVKDRDTTGQILTLTCRLPNFAPIVASSNEPELRDALADVREDMWRQIDDAVGRRKEGVR
jgi:ribosome-associated translation inhibitor RaiA